MRPRRALPAGRLVTQNMTAILTGGTRGFIAVVAAALVATGIGRVGFAQTRDCDAVPADKKTAVNAIFAALHPYDGCDETFARCLLAKPPTPVVLRLASDICRQVTAGAGRKQVEQSLAKRAQSMLPTGPRATIALDATMSAGSATAPVVAAVYACARCPFCKVMVAALHKAVTDGPLAGKVRLYFRPFPLKSHENSTEGGLAMVAAARLGPFWPFTLHMYENFDGFCPKLLPEWAEAVGMDRKAFEREYADSKTRESLVASKQEGLRNKVSATPSIFIDGRPYLYDLTTASVLDVLEEAYEAASAAKK
jgi:protein-disulfide isomerase